MEYVYALPTTVQNLEVGHIIVLCIAIDLRVTKRSDSAYVTYAAILSFQPESRAK
jgi:hypothetical protein